MNESRPEETKRREEPAEIWRSVASAPVSDENSVLICAVKRVSLVRIVLSCVCMMVNWLAWVSVRLVATLLSERDFVTIEDPERSNSNISVKMVIDSRYSSPVRVMDPDGYGVI